MGGSGDVGQRLATVLSEISQRSIVLCGRDEQKAEALAKKIGGRLEGRSLDVSVEIAADQIPAESSVVNLTEATHPAVARAVVRSGGIFIESAASPSYVNSIAETASLERSGLVVINAGLMPGLSNVLADALGKNLSDVAVVDIVIEMGMGRHYGEAATRWMIKNLGKPYEASDKDKPQLALPGELQRSVLFEEDQKTRLALGFPFSAQRDVPSGVESIRSFLAIEPPWMTQLIAVVLKLGLGGRLSKADKRVDWLLRRFPVSGRARTRLFVEGLDRTGNTIASIQVSSGDQADITAEMLAETLLAAEKTTIRGLFETQHILEPDQALGAVERSSPDTGVFFSSDKAIDAILFGKGAL